jgi:hypothetical protein
MEIFMQSSVAYLEFRRLFSAMQSTARVGNLVSLAAAWARNLPEIAEIDLPALISRAARFQAISVSAEETLEVTRLLEEKLSLVRH